MQRSQSSLKTRRNCGQWVRHANEGSKGAKLRSDWSYKGRKNKHGAVVIIDPSVYDAAQTQSINQGV